MGDSMADDPDDALLVADEGDAGSILPGDFTGAEEVGEGCCMAVEAEGVEAVGGGGSAEDEGWLQGAQVEGFPERVRGLLPWIEGGPEQGLAPEDLAGNGEFDGRRRGRRCRVGREALLEGGGVGVGLKGDTCADVATCQRVKGGGLGEAFPSSGGHGVFGPASALPEASEEFSAEGWVEGFEAAAVEEDEGGVEVFQGVGLGEVEGLFEALGELLRKLTEAEEGFFHLRVIGSGEVGEEVVADAGAGMGRVFVGGIVSPGLVEVLEEVLELLAIDRGGEEGADEGDVGRRGGGWVGFRPGRGGRCL